MKKKKLKEYEGKRVKATCTNLSREKENITHEGVLTLQENTARFSDTGICEYEGIIEVEEVKESK